MLYERPATPLPLEPNVLPDASWVLPISACVEEERETVRVSCA